MLALITFVQTRASAQEPSRQPGRPDAAAGPGVQQEDLQAADRQALLKLRDLYEQAAASGDLPQLRPHLDPGFTGVMVTNEGVDSFADVQAYWDKIAALLGPGGKYRTKINVEGPALIVGDLAIAHGTGDDVAITGAGKSYEFSTRWTAVCRRNGDGKWRILRVHGSMDPLNNPFIRAADNFVRILVAVIGAVTGGIVGFLGGRWLRRARGK